MNLWPAFYILFPEIYQSSANTETCNGKWQNLLHRIFKYCFPEILTVFQETSFRDFYLSKRNLDIV